MSSIYLRLPNLEIRRANALPAWWFVGLAHPMAALGLARNLARRQNNPEASVALIHHDGQLLVSDYGQYALLPCLLRGASLIDKADYAKGSMSLSSQPQVYAHLRISLVIRLASDPGISLEAVTDFLKQGARFAGGTIVSFDPPELFTSLDDVKRKLKSGFCLQDRTPLMQQTMAEQSCTPMEALLWLTQPTSKKPVVKADEPAAPQESWLSPAVLGYATLTPASKKPGARDFYPHAYAEPLVGLVRYQPVKEGLAFWRYAEPVNNDVFLITTH